MTTLSGPLSVFVDTSALVRLKERIRGALAHAASDDGTLPQARPSPSPSVPRASPAALATPPLAPSARGIQSAFTPLPRAAQTPAAPSRASAPPPVDGELPPDVAAALAGARALRALDL